MKLSDEKTDVDPGDADDRRLTATFVHMLGWMGQATSKGIEA